MALKCPARIAAWLLIYQLIIRCPAHLPLEFRKPAESLPVYYPNYSFCDGELPSSATSMT